MRKQIALVLLATAGIAGLYLIARNQHVVKNDAYFEGVSQYVYAFTSGAIGRDDAIRIRFVHAAVSPETVGQAVPAEVFSVSPELAGQAVWEDDRTIKLQPGAPLPPGSKYTATVQLRKIWADAPAPVSHFDFEFHAKAIAYEVITDGIGTDPSDPRRQQVTGRVHINEAMEGAQVEKMLQARQEGKTLLVSWNHAADGQTHTFTVQGVERSKVRSKVQLAWSGAAIGAQKDGQAEQVVAAFDEFTVLSARAVQVEEQYILLNFSDPVSASQDLNGLIRLEEYKGKLRFVVDGNFVRAYPDSRLTGTIKLQVESGVRNSAGQAMRERVDFSLEFSELKPAVRLVGRGAIIPQSDQGGVLFPFEAVGLTAVDVEVFKIYNASILQYLQVNEMEGEQELERVGKIILQKKILLTDLNPDASAANWQRYALELKDMIRQDPGAIYQVRLAFKRGYTNFPCAGAAKGEEKVGIGQTDEDGQLTSILGGERGVYWAEEDPWYYSEEDENGYNWDSRQDACKDEYYYYEHFAKRNVFVSDLGLTAKRGRDGSLFLAVTDLHSAQPVNNVELELYNYQLQSIGKGRTESDGTTSFENLREVPFVAVANKGGRRGYLRMADGNTLSLSRFDVAGSEAQKGLKGYLYGERGVWRPGDSIYLNFVLEDKTGKLPADHPVTLELTDPRGALQSRIVTTYNVNRVYPLFCATRLDAPTGNWTAKVLVGGASFTKQLKIETVKPNRLKLDLNFGKTALSRADKSLTGKLAVNWLHGAVAKGLKAKVDLQVRAVKTEFPNFQGFVFDDPARFFSSEPQVLYDADIDQAGLATVPLKLGDLDQAPGKLIANFKVRAFEKSGDFSTDNFALDYFPYDRFVGVSIPNDRWGGKSIDQRGGMVQFAAVDKTGKAQPGRKIQVALYRTDWRWWWDEDATSGAAQFNNAENVTAIDQATLTTDTRGLATWKVKPTGWGRYFVRVADEEGGHASGDFFWSGYPEQLDDMKSRNAAAMLPFTVEKEKYNVGEEVTLKVPAGESGRILLTLETGTRVAKHLWFDAKAGDNYLKFKTEGSMSPTVYAHVSLMQPHAQTKNDLPIRMYGVVPVNVENPNSRLTPVIDMPDALRPGEPFTIAIREARGGPCAYTIAVVDEGLLDLTRFKTPNPWDALFAREALGVKTWDIYDYVLGAYGASLERVLSIGGDGINQKAKNAVQVNRFKATVLHVGPVMLEKGQVRKHTLQIDNYVGSVRVMVVMSAPGANGAGAYGSAEKTCAVRKPLMILPTLPRVLGPGETLRLPVDVFAMEKQVQSATIRVKESSGLVTVQGSPVNTLTFKEPGEEMTYFDLKVGQKTGIAKFSIVAQGGGETATQEIELLIRNPNPVVTKTWDGVIEPGQEWSGDFDPAQYTDIAQASFEVSALPPVNMSRHLQYLIQYPHGCIEQTTSAAFPQLYVDILAPLSEKQKADITKNVTAAVNKIRNYQASSGGFSYWPGGNEVNAWSNSYAGHFLVEARTKGYALPEGLLERWIDYQTNTSRQWQPQNSSDKGNRFDSDLNQAYRLYTLALAGKPDMAGMNRLREQKDLYTQSAYLLANAYAQSGKPEAAREITAGKWREDWNYEWSGYTYGSDLRDRSLLLETYTNIGDMPRAQAMVNYICSEIGGEEKWYWTTQSLSTALRALSKYAAKNLGNAGVAYSYRIGAGGSFKNGDGSRPIGLVDFTEQSTSASKITIKNSSGAKLYARLSVSGQNAVGDQSSQSSNITVAVRYTDANNKVLDPAKIAQGTDFYAEVTVQRSSTLSFPFTELALSQIFPSGWEIMNDRMSNIPTSGSSPADYQDVRDDRVFTYFDLNNKAKETRVYRVQLNAAYAGRYYLPTVGCEAMYDKRIRASVPGKWVEVI